MRYLAASDQPLGSTRTLLRENVDGGSSGATASTVRRTVLPGGLRVITETMPGARSATLGLWTKVGSRDESGRCGEPRTSSSTCCSRGPSGVRRWTSRPARRRGW
jgi:hypothetical protein